MLAHFAHHILTALLAPLLPFIREDLALDYTQLGLVLSAFSLTYGASQLLAGWLADRIGPRISMTIGIVGVAVAGLLVGLSQTYIMLLIFLVLMGIAGGGYHPSAPPLISKMVEPKNRGRALGLHQIGGSASFMIAPLIAAAIAAAWGWRVPFIGLAIPTIVFGIIFYMILGKRTDTPKTDYKITDNLQEEPRPPGQWRRLIILIFMSTFVGATVMSVGAFIPLYMVDHFGVSEGQAAVFLAILYSTGIVASPLGGYLSDRWGTVPVILGASLLAGPAIFLLNLAPYGWGVSAVLVVMGITIFIRMPATESYIISHTPAQHRSTIFGVYYFFAMESGGVLTPIIGYLIDQFGFYLSFTIMGAVTAAVSIICAMLLRGIRS